MIVGSLFTVKWLCGLCTDDPLDLKLFISFKWFKIPFSSVCATFSASRGERVSVKSFVLDVVVFHVHSSSPAAMPHFLAISAKAPQNCSRDSLSRCFRFNSLCRSNVTFVFLTKAVARKSQNSLIEICKIFTFVIFCPKIVFPSFSKARYKTDRSFFSASSSRVPLIFLVSVLMEADS